MSSADHGRGDAVVVRLSSQRYALQGAAFIGAVAAAGGAGARVASAAAARSSARSRPWPRRSSSSRGASCSARSRISSATSRSGRSADIIRVARERRRHRRLLQVRAAEHGVLPAIGRSWKCVLPDHLRAVFYSSSDVHFVMPEAEYQQRQGSAAGGDLRAGAPADVRPAPKNFLDGVGAAAVRADLQPSVT